MNQPIQCRTVFLSDVHLGATGCKVGAVEDFLESIECDTLFLVGDIIDGWVTRQKRWKQEHTNLLRSILGKSKRGTRICYTPGNHDGFMRRMNGSELGFIEIDHEFVHTTADGKDLLIVHGDLFDPTCVKHSWLAWVGAWMYEYIQIFNQRVNRRRKNARRPIDFASPIKRLVKGIFTRQDFYDALLMEHARENGYDGVICGHVHRPELRILDDGFVYGNTGDWVESLTAIVEHQDGKLELIHWAPVVQELDECRQDRLARIRALRAARTGVRR